MPRYDLARKGRAKARPTVLILTGLLFSCVLSEYLSSQTNPPRRYWVCFNDKGSQHISIDPQSLGISPRALKRRAKVLPHDRLIDDRDLPVAEEYVSQLCSRGLKILATSRWFNSVSVEISAEQIADLRPLPFITSLEVVPTARRPQQEVSVRVPSSMFFKSQQTAAIDYGPSATQVRNMNVPDVHALGINGSGILVGMIDDGFNNHKTHNALRHIPVLAEFDYVQGDSNTSRQGTDAPGQGDHGASTMSVLAGFEGGKLIGPAYGVSMVLAKSEYDPTETQIELDHYVEALEWMERMGVDIVSTSLGYDDLDPSGQVNAGDILYSMKDGNTAVTSKAARVAASKGVLLVTAMGNEGMWRFNDNWQVVNGQTGSIVTPADADSIIAVGATFSDGIRADFSSTGPTADGRVKPEVVAQGTAIIAADGPTNTGYYGITRSSTQGTSFSTPLTAGVAALVLSARPELTPMQVRTALLNTATHINDPDPVKNITAWPNNWYGYGFVNALEAVLYNGLVVSNRPIVIPSDSFFTVTVWIKSRNSLTADSLVVFHKRTGESTFRRSLLIPSGNQGRYYARISRVTIDSTSIGYVYARDNSGAVRSGPYNAPDSLFSFAPTPDSVSIVYPPPVGNSVPDDFVLHPNYPNPFNSTTTIFFGAPRSEEVELTVYNILGQKIRTLFSGFSGTGLFSQGVTWDGRDEFRQPVPSGVYICRLKTPVSVISNKMLYIK